jgi:DNA-binding transcriptional MerR regulator
MSAAARSTRRERLLTIGAVCQRLKDDFPEISISKIRYLEDQGLLTPRRTRGGYRLFGEDDVDRLRRILELQRDEFLPLRVIRQELAAPSRQERKRRRAGLTEQEAEIDLDELVERSGVPRDLVRELEEFGILEPRSEGGSRWYSETDVQIASACARLARFGISGRHLRTFRTAADRESALLEALLAPSLRSRNAERREQAVRELEALGDAAHELSRLLFWRDLRAFVAR